MQGLFSGDKAFNVILKYNSFIVSKGAKIIATAFVTLFLGVIGFGFYFFDIANKTSRWNPPTKNPPEKNEGFLVPNTAWSPPGAPPQE